MKSIILGTAGHVDHGKTALVEALTGVNTDRWEEERRRGITIDLGFAPFPGRPDDLALSVVDVPGHEDFVKNMLAGASGVDFLLLVVAADEGPMPQTHEHLWISHLLGVERGVAAVTKTDLVDSQWRDLVVESVRECIQDVFGSHQWPVIPVSALTGDGLPQLQQALLGQAAQVEGRRDDDLFRLPIDRSFTVKGVGTVVTGTIWGGRASAGDELRLLPADRQVRVRGVQAHGREVESVGAGQRAAIALVGIDRDDVGRGDLLTSAAVWRASHYIDAWLRLLPSSPWPLKNGQRVRFHLGTAETLARVALLERKALAPGEEALVQLRLERPSVARCGDRFVVRFYSPVTTIGGGVVLDPWAARHSRLRPGDGERLRSALQPGSPAHLVQAIAARGDGTRESELAVIVGRSPSELRRALDSISGQAVRRVGERWFGVAALEAAREAVLATLADGHARDPAARGVSLESLRSTLGRPIELVNAVLSDLERRGAIRIEGSLAALPEHVPRLRPEQVELAKAAAARIRAAGFAPPNLKALAGAFGVPEEELLPLLRFMAERQQLVAVTPDLYFDAAVIAQAKRRLREALAEGPAPPAQLRQALEVSRKYLIPLLEHLDATGFTRRTAEGRVLRESA